MPPPVALRAPFSPKLVLARNALRANGGGESVPHVGIAEWVSPRRSSALRSRDSAARDEVLAAMDGAVVHRTDSQRVVGMARAAFGATHPLETGAAALLLVAALGILFWAVAPDGW